jgi:hypothetical protein
VPFCTFDPLQQPVDLLHHVLTEDLHHPAFLVSEVVPLRHDLGEQICIKNILWRVFFVVVDKISTRCDAVCRGVLHVFSTIKQISRYHSRVVYINIQIRTMTHQKPFKTLLLQLAVCAFPPIAIVVAVEFSVSVCALA